MNSQKQATRLMKTNYFKLDKKCNIEYKMDRLQFAVLEWNFACKQMVHTRPKNFTEKVIILKKYDIGFLALRL